MEEDRKSELGAWVGAALALAYMVSLLDVIQDVFPAIGWLGDMLVVVIAVLNIIRTYVGDISSSWLQ